MDYKKIKTCINNAIKRINNNKKGCSCAWVYIKNYCDNNYLTLQERTYIYKTIDKYLSKKEKQIA